MGQLRFASADVVRSVIGKCILADEKVATSPSAATVGAITLTPAQLSAARRLRASIAEFGGGLLCDPVGSGKTYVALSIASRTSRVLVVAPAVLRDMWSGAANRCERLVEFHSFEALSRGNGRVGDCDLIIIDEAHHARNPRARRYPALAKLVAKAPAILLSATPIHNNRRELAALLALFLGERSLTLSHAELARCVIRREREAALGGSSIPVAEPLELIDVTEDDSIPQMLLALPPPLPPSDGGDGGVLVVRSLLRQWASSTAALRDGLVRRLRKCVGLMTALEEGRYPSRAELAAWNGAEDSVQLAFAPLVSAPFHGADELLPVLRAHREALAAIRSGIAHDERDEERAEILRRLRRAHPDRRIVAFSQYAGTVDALFNRLLYDGHVAALHGSGARVAGGTISRAEALARFAPIASKVAPKGRAEDVTLLLATDLVSEGVNLQDGGVVVHLDLPWTPARMEQRLGRITRIGSVYDRVFSYALRPPASAASILKVEQILAQKMGAAGIVAPDFPALNAAEWLQCDTELSRPEIAESIRAIASRWAASASIDSTNVVAGIAGPADGFLAAIDCGDEMVVLCSRSGVISDDPAMVLDCMKCVIERRIDLSPETVEAAATSALNHVVARRALDHRGDVSPSRRALLRRIAMATSRARMHSRARIAALSQTARSVVLSSHGAHVDRELTAVADSFPASDEHWLHAVIAAGQSSSTRHRTRDTAASPQVVALLVIQTRAA